MTGYLRTNTHLRNLRIRDTVRDADSMRGGQLSGYAELWEELISWLPEPRRKPFAEVLQ